MDQPKRTSASPEWYRNTAIIFFLIAAVLFWAALTRHDWLYWAFAGITFMNGIMTTFKFITLRGSGK
jgi:hypothetical protein